MKDEVVTISLNKKNIASMLGALRMGSWLENWCAGLTMASMGTCDTRSMRWRASIEFMIEQIKSQTGIQKEWKEYGENDAFINEMLKWVNERSATLSKEFDAYIEDQHEASK